MWLTIIILAYFILAIVFLVDKYLLIGAIPNPKVYVFYVGILGLLALALAPFVGFYVPEKSQIILSLLAGSVFIFGLFWFYKALQIFEASRVVPAVGGLTPLFTFGLIYVSSGGKEIPSYREIIAFVLLVLGSILINFRKEKMINLRSFGLSLFAAFFMSLAFVLTKYVYLAQPFWNGFIWRSIGGSLMAFIFFIIFPEIRKEIFKKREKVDKKSSFVFLANQAAGGGAAILQNFAIFLTPLVYIPIIHALNGIQYVFLFVFSVFLSLKLPQIMKEEISKEIIFQKVSAIVLISLGLALIAFK